jgi:hypothetical protein
MLQKFGSYIRVFLILLVITIIGLYFYIHTQNLVEKEHIQKIQSINQPSTNNVPLVSLDDLYLINQKNSYEATSSPIYQKRMYFDLEKESSMSTMMKVTIYLKGPDTALTDAGQIAFQFDPKMWKILNIISGDSYPLYPKIVSIANIVTVIGTASINNNSISYGKPNTIFATILFEKSPFIKTVSAITNVSNQTGIYFHGSSIRDESQLISSLNY